MIDDLRFWLHGWLLVGAVWVLPKGVPKMMLKKYADSYLGKLDEYYAEGGGSEKS